MQGPDCEVLVVGAGPAGCWTARRLAEGGRDVVLADENPGARPDVVCTGIVGEEAFRRLDLPEGAVVDRVRRAVFRSPGGRQVDYAPSGALARVVDRTRFDAGLADRAADAGARVLRGWAARSVTNGGPAVEVGFETDGGQRRLRASYLVVATGHQRWLHEAAGLGTPDGYVHGVHADLPFRDARGAELYFGEDVAPGFFAWAVPFGDGTARLGVLAPQGAREHFARFLRHPAVRPRLELPDGAGVDDVVRGPLQSRGIVQGPVRPGAAGRVLAVGEAAGQVKTTTAGGIYYGIRGAEVAADHLEEALATGDAGVLEGYDDAWWELLGPEIEAGLRLQRAGRSMDDAGIDRLFSRLQGALGSVVERLVRFDWHRPALETLLSHGLVRRYLAGGDGGAAPAPGAGPEVRERAG